jgi:hypothetical protein
VEALILSFGLDTNGQNYRYVEAARKHGSDERVLRAFAIGKADPAGVVGRFKQAADKHGGLVIREAHRAENYMEFPADIVWRPGAKSAREVRELANAADVIHLNNSYTAYQKFRLAKPALLHHHGSLFRSNPDHMLDVSKRSRFIQAVSTIDLQKPAPDVLHWLPSAYDVEALHDYAQANRREPDGKVRIVHAPTNRSLKHTDLLIRAVEELQADKVKVELDLVEGVTNEECLARKAKADIVYDQLLYGYGCNSIEAWAMGIPVIAGADEWTLARMGNQWDAIPFEEATEKTLKRVIRDMVKSKDLREDATLRGVNHVRKYHDELPALERLAELYHDAIQTKARPRIAGKGVTFRAKKQIKHVDGQPLAWQGGTVVVQDVDVIKRLRRMAKQRPMFGIEEVA